MTKLIIETDDNWTREKIKLAIGTEIYLLKKTEEKYGKLDREKLYSKIDDMELIEWEGEIESLQKAQSKLKSLEEECL